MQNDTYRFSRVRMADFAMLKKWLATPGVREWWGDPDEQASLLLQDLRDSRMAVAMNIVSIDDTPIAYIQDYEVHAWPQKHLTDLPSGTRAIDTFIGMESHMGLGHGSGYLRQRAQRLLANGAPLIVIDPDVGNARAIRAYEKAGFEQISVEDTSEGPVVLMEYQPASQPSV